MNTRRVLAATAALAAVALHADDGLLQRSPFAPPAAPTAGAPAAAQGTIDVLGVTRIAGETLLNLFDRSTNRGAWVPVGGRWGGLEILAFEAARNVALVDGPQGRQELPLKIATGSAGTPPAPTATPQRSVIASTATVANPAEQTPAVVEGTAPPGLAEALAQSQNPGAGQSPVAAVPTPNLFLASRSTALLPRERVFTGGQGLPQAQLQPAAPQTTTPPTAPLPGGAYRFTPGNPVPPGFNVVADAAGTTYVVPPGAAIPQGFTRLTGDTPGVTTPVRRPRLVLNNNPAPDTPPRN